jgi:SOS-response transcriptional repressor LexA
MYDYMLDYQLRHGQPATVREIAEAVGIASSGTAWRHLNKLRRQGLVDQADGQARGWRAIDNGQTEPRRAVLIRFDDNDDVTAATIYTSGSRAYAAVMRSIRNHERVVLVAACLDERQAPPVEVQA